MKVLVVCQYYYPEPFRLPDICEELARRGHKVTVLTGLPNYPMGELYEGYEKGQRREEYINGVHVVRCWTHPRKSGTLHRLINYFSYPISAWLKVGKLDGDHDVVLINQQSPVMMAWPGMRYGRKHRKPTVMYCMDLWPASLAAGGISASSSVYRMFHLISGYVYQHMDRILVTSCMFTEYLHEEFGVDKSKVDYLPQYAEDVFNSIEPTQSQETTNLVFAGNIGVAQSLDTVLDAAEQLPMVRFHIVGDGVELGRLKQRASENVEFYGRRPLEEMPQFYAMADAMLVTLQADPVLSMTLPGKVQSYMAAGKPIIGAADGEVATTLEKAQCGYCGPAKDAQTLVTNIERFIANPHKQRLASNARRYYIEHFARSMFMDALEGVLRDESTRIRSSCRRRWRAPCPQAVPPGCA